MCATAPHLLLASLLVMCVVLLGPGPGPAGWSRLAEAMNLDRFAVVVISQSTDDVLNSRFVLGLDYNSGKWPEMKRRFEAKMRNKSYTPPQMFGYSVGVQDYTMPDDEDGTGRTRIRLLVGAPHFSHPIRLAPEPGFGLQYMCDIEQDSRMSLNKDLYTCKPASFDTQERMRRIQDFGSGFGSRNFSDPDPLPDPSILITVPEL